MTPNPSAREFWPALPWEEWQDTATTLHMWTQMVGKTRLALTPLENHWWNVPLYVTSRGLSTSAIPYGAEIFDIEFDFIDHLLRLETSSGQSGVIELGPKSVAAFYKKYLELLRSFGIEPVLNPKPVEVAVAIPFPEDDRHASYDREFAHRFWRILQRCDTLFKRFRAGFIGKSSPVHFFWGSFDLAVTRFSGRPAPPRPGADLITREAYSHEVISAGFWPGNGGFGAPAFYAYAAPQPAGLEKERLRPAEAFYSDQLQEFILRYDDARRSPSPDDAVLEFLDSSYDKAATLGNWDRASLERPGVRSETGDYLTAATPEGLAVIHSSPITLSWVPRDIVTNAYNVGGIVMAGTFDTLDAARRTAERDYSVSPRDWRSANELPSDLDSASRTENHIPDIEGHEFRRHDTRWK